MQVKFSTTVLEIKKITPVFEDERGSIWDFLTNVETHHIGFLTTKKGSIRGNHYHKEQKQYTLVLHGQIEVTTKNLLDKNSEIEIFDLNEMEMVEFPPFCFHSLKAKEDSECLVFTSKGRHGTEYEDDTFRIKDIKSYKHEEN